MKNQTTPVPPPRQKQLVRVRFFWFLAGGGVNYLLIKTPLSYLEKNTALPLLAITACSIAVSQAFFFCWNYFINFRTDSRKRDALARYATAVAMMWALSTCLLWFLKQFDAKMAFSLGRFPLDLDIIATQFFLSGLKFFLYHKWVFPIPKEAPASK